MKKLFLFSLACALFAGSAMANGVTTPEKKVSPSVEKPKKSSEEAADSERTFHIAKCVEDNKVLLMVGKKPHTRVTVRVFDKEGTLLYIDRISAKHDFSTILNLRDVDGPTIKISDSSGIEKAYTL